MFIPRESVEYLPLTVLLDGEPTAYEVSVVAANVRPATWTPGPYLISGLAVGVYDAYTRVTDNPEAPVSGPVRFWIT